MPSLLNPTLKVKRAKVHLNALKREVHTFTESKPYRITTHEDVERGEYRIRVWFKHPRIRLGLIAGDFISCLRASLDYLAWQLAALKVDPPGRNVHFPVLGVYGKGTEAALAGALAQMPKEARQVIRSLQPYQSGSAYKQTYLWRLDYLWNVEKHRHIPFRSGDVLITLPRGKFAPRPRAEMFDDYGDLIFPLSAKSHLHLDPRVKIGVQFGDRDTIEETVDSLAEIYEYVRDKVIPRFARFFPKPPKQRK